MARRPDTPCATCGKLLYSGKGALPAGQRTCHECRRLRRAESPTPPQRQCQHCGEPAVARSRYPICKACQYSACEICDKPFKRKTAPDRNGLIQRSCSRECGWWVRYAGRASTVPWRDCITCGRAFIAHRGRRTCSECLAPSAYVPALRVAKACVECGKKSIPSPRGEGRAQGRLRTRFCSKSCAKRASNRSRRHAERAAGKRNAAKRMRYQRQRDQRKGPAFTLLEIAVRDGWRCHLCGKKVSRKQASLDHLVPLVDGGEHSLTNVALAHHLCNSLRQDGGDVQLLLIG